MGIGACRGMKRTSSGYDIYLHKEDLRFMKDISEDEMREIYESFRCFDKDGDGHITKTEIVHVLRSLNVNTTDEEIDNMIREVDKDGNGIISFSEFVQMMAYELRKSKPIRESDLVCALEEIDRDKNGRISLVELQYVLDGFGLKASIEDLSAVASLVDIHSDGTIDYYEFVKVLSEISSTAEKSPSPSTKSSNTSSI